MPKGKCAVEGCNTGVLARGWCSMHYERWMKTGETGPVGSYVMSNQGKVCSGPECSREAKVKGLCVAHYSILRSGKPLRPINQKRSRNLSLTVPEQIAADSKRDEGSGCLIWTGSVDGHGYPLLGKAVKGTRFVHRISYRMSTGEDTPSHLPVHHACGVRLCVEPKHLQLVHPHENTAEMLERKWYRARIESLESALAEVCHDHPLLVRP